VCHFQLADPEENAHVTGTGRNSEGCSLYV